MSDLSSMFDDEEETLPGIMFFDMSQISMATAFVEFQNSPVTTDLLRHLVLNSIKFNLKKFKEEYPIVVLCFDNADGEYWRRDYGYYYKKNRKKAREESTFDWEGFFTGMKEVTKEISENMPYITLNIPRVEADDTIGVLTKRLSIKGHKILIVSSDGDYYQLHKYPGVKQWAPTLKKFVDKKKDGTPTEFLMTKLLKGDKKDGVACVKVRSDYILTKLDGERAPNITKKLIEGCLDDGPEKHLNESEMARYKENQIMIDMDFIPEEIQKRIIEEYDNFKVPGRNKIYPYFVSKKLVKLSRELNQF